LGVGITALCWPSSFRSTFAQEDDSLPAGDVEWHPTLETASPAKGGLHYVVCVHGICCHRRGFSKCWWRALKPHLPEIPDEQVLEVNWSDLVGGCPRALLPQVDELPDYVQVGPNCLNDIPDYMLKDDVRCRILQRFEGVVRPLLACGATLHVIGHSWGSLISYESLRTLDSSGDLTGRVGTLFSVGSPMWMKFVRKHLAQRRLALCKPSLVDCWVSVEGCNDLLGRSIQPYFDLDIEYLNTPAVGCPGVYGISLRNRRQRRLCPHFSYFRCANVAVNRDIFASHIRASIVSPSPAG
jgi:hypothetical protein